MHNAGAMGCAKCLQHLPHDLQAALQGRCVFKPIAQGFAFHQLRHQVVGADVVESADIGMVQRRYGPRLLLESFAEVLGGNFNGDGAV